MDTNAVIIVLAEPFGLDDRRDIFGEIVLQEVRQNFFARAIRVRGPPDVDPSPSSCIASCRCRQARRAATKSAARSGISRGEAGGAH
jgi:hypothetical protein